MSRTWADAPEKPTSSPSKKIGTHDRDVRRVGGAAVGVVVEDDVAVVDVVAEERNHVLDDLRHRTHEHGCRVGLGQLVALMVEDARAEVLRFADDRRVGHAVEHPCHLLGDRRKCTADHAYENGRRELRPRAPSARSGFVQSMRMFPKRSISAARPGGTIVVESYCSDDRRPLQAVALPGAGRVRRTASDGARPCRRRRTRLALESSRTRRVTIGRLQLRRLEGSTRPTASARTLTISIFASNRWPYSAS